MKAPIVLLTLFAATISADASQWTRADIYFGGWYTERAVAIDAEGLRNEARHGFSRLVRVSTPAEIQQLITILDLPRFRDLQGDPRRDTRLVVDLFDRRGARTTYHGDNRELCNAACTRGREVDEHFRKFVEQITRWPNQAMQPTATVRMPSSQPFMNATCNSRGG